MLGANWIEDHRVSKEAHRFTFISPKQGQTLVAIEKTPGVWDKNCSEPQIYIADMYEPGGGTLPLKELIELLKHLGYIKE